jgi:hypothetical protein
VIVTEKMCSPTVRALLPDPRIEYTAVGKRNAKAVALRGKMIALGARLQQIDIELSRAARRNLRPETRLARIRADERSVAEQLGGRNLVAFTR